jgi:hypothetical protein
MGVDALSTLLMKNPHFNLLPVDITFLRSFQSEWRRLEADEINSMVDRNEVTYQLPAACYDPILLLMFFRQNISGSTFFHIRNDPPSDDEANAIVGHDKLQDEYQADRGTPFYFQEKDFALYFNASPAQLDPTFQPVTTLTEAGTNRPFLFHFIIYNELEVSFDHDYCRYALLSSVRSGGCFNRCKIIEIQ